MKLGNNWNFLFGLHFIDAQDCKFAIAEYSKYSSGEISRLDYMKCMGYHFVANVIEPRTVHVADMLEL